VLLLDTGLVVAIAEADIRKKEKVEKAMEFVERMKKV